MLVGAQTLPYLQAEDQALTAGSGAPNGSTEEAGKGECPEKGVSSLLCGLHVFYFVFLHSRKEKLKPYDSYELRQCGRMARNCPLLCWCCKATQAWWWSASVARALFVFVYHFPAFVFYSLSNYRYGYRCYIFCFWWSFFGNVLLYVMLLLLLPGWPFSHWSIKCNPLLGVFFCQLHCQYIFCFLLHALVNHLFH